MKAPPERADYPTGPAPDYTEGQPARSCRRGLEKRSARTVLRRYLASALLTALLSLTLAACAKKHHIDIQSNTCWTAVIDQEGGSIANDCGNATFRVAGEVHCCAVRNLNDTGFVRVRIDDGVWAVSSAPKGTAQACR